MHRHETYDGKGDLIDVVERPFTEEEELQKVTIERIKAYEVEGWKTPFDLLDDILNEGIDNVKARRAAIKNANPKP